MADIMIRKRKRMRSKEVKALAKELEDVMGVPVTTTSSSSRATSSGWSMRRSPS